MSSLNYSLFSKDEKAQNLNLIYSLIDSKIDIIDKKVRQLIERLKRRNDNHHPTRLSVLEDELSLNLLQGEMNYIGASAHVQFFSEVENMSRSMYILECMKMGLRPDNLSDIMFLLEDDKYLNIPEPQIRQIFSPAS